MFATRTIKTSITVLALALLVSCGKKEEPAPKAAAPATAAQAMAAQATEVRQLVEDTNRYTESLKAQPAGDHASAEQLSKLPGLLEQLLRHMEERAQASQQGGDVAKPEAQVAEDLKQIQEVQSALPAPTGEQPGTPALAGQEKPPLDRISENLAKITQIAQQGKELVALVRPSKRQRDVSAPSEGASAEGTPPADGAQASEPQASEQVQPTAAVSSPALAISEPASGASGSRARGTEPETKATEVSSARTCCTVVANPAMKGRLGRLVVTYPEGTNVVDARIDVSKEGKQATYGHGNQAFELLPGSYTVVISGKRVDNVTVQSGHDTKVKVGVLRVTAPGGTRMDVLDKDRKTQVTYGHGNKEFGLPIGTVHVQIAGQMEAVTIQEGKITDF